MPNLLTHRVTDAINIWHTYMYTNIYIYIINAWHVYSNKQDTPQKYVCLSLGGGNPIGSVNGDVPLEQRLMTCLRAIAVRENEGPMGLHNRT